MLDSELHQIETPGEFPLCSWSRSEALITIAHVVQVRFTSGPHLFGLLPESISSVVSLPLSLPPSLSLSPRRLTRASPPTPSRTIPSSREGRRLAPDNVYVKRSSTTRFQILAITCVGKFQCQSKICRLFVFPPSYAAKSKWVAVRN